MLEGKVPSKKGHEAAGAKEAETVTSQQTMDDHPNTDVGFEKPNSIQCFIQRSGV